MTDFGGTSRYRVERPIGSGGMGVVYEATDNERGTRVALKTLRHIDASSVIRFKDEFRALADIHHENLVRFGELAMQGNQYFFTMELLRGTDFLSYVRPGSVTDSTPSTQHLHEADTAQAADTAPAAVTLERRTGTLDETKLRTALAQLARGLSALHAAGKVHRDVKPTNILVEARAAHGDRVVLVDFGLVTEANAASNEAMAGTVAYMAPEQATGDAVGPAADWYAVGVLLYEALTGQIPFHGSAYEVLQTKRTARPPRPSDVAPEVPVDLDDLCCDLLEPDPAARPTGDEVLRRLGLPATRPSLMPTSHGPSAAPFVGRRLELEQLQRAYEQARRGTSVTVYVHGESGLGKTALARHFIDTMQKGDPEVVVLKGRCYERESVPYKAVDGVIDSLGRWLMRLPRAALIALLPRDAARLGRAFPALERLEKLPSQPAYQLVESVRSSELDPALRRMRVFYAMRDLLHAISEERLVVLLIDDLQWADADSLLLLREIMRAPPAAIMVVATVRTERDATRTMAAGGPPASLPASRLNVGSSAMPGDVRIVHLQPLGEEESLELAAALMERADGTGAGARATESTAEVIAREAAGHPLFIDELVRHAWEPGASSRRLRAIRLEDALWSRIQATEELERKLLEVLSVARGPLSYEAAAAACGLAQPSDLDEAVAKLRFERLVRTTRMTTPRERTALEAYHDRVRHAVLTHLGDETDVHAAIAKALEACGDPDLEALAEHHRGAGDLERAAGYALRAAEIAASQLAFDRAARLYEWTFAMRPTAATGETLVAFAHALACAGRGKAAADVFLRAAASSDNVDDVLSLKRRAAHNLLTTGHTREGMEVLDDVLRALDVKLAPTPRRALISLAMHRARLRVRGIGFSRRQATPRQLARVDACFTASAGLAFVDTVRGAELQARGLLLALQAGDAARVASALTNEAAFAALAGERSRPRWTAMLDAARALATETKDQRVLGHVLVGEGVALHLSGYWQASRVRCEDALRVLREHSPSATWEIDAAMLYSLRSLLHLGQLPLLRMELPERIADAEARGDRFAAGSLRAGELNMLWLALGDVDTARHELDAATEPAGEMVLPRVQELFARARIELYTGEAARAHDRLSMAWDSIGRSQLMRVRYLRILLMGLRARTALATARTGRQGRGLLDEAARFTNEVARCGESWALAEAAMLRGCIGHALGDSQRAAVSFEQAARDYTACDMAVHAAIARLRFGKLAGTDEGRATATQARAWLQGQGVADPDALAAVLAP